MPSGFRELHMSAESLFKFLCAVSARPVRIDRGQLPGSSALSKFDADPASGLIVLTVFDQWRGVDDVGEQIELVYSSRVTDKGNASDWGTPILLTEPRPGL